MQKKDIGKLDLKGASQAPEFRYTMDIDKIGSLQPDQSMALVGEDVITVGFMITGGMSSKYKGITRYPDENKSNQHMGVVVSACLAAMSIAKPIVHENKAYDIKRISTAYATDQYAHQQPHL